METIDNRIFGKDVCTMESIAEHVKKHNVDMTSEEIVKIADRITEGKEGIHVYENSFGSSRTIVIRGFVERDGKKYGIIRTMWDDEAGAGNERTGLTVIKHYFENNFPLTCKNHGVVPYAHGWCPFCEGGS